MLTYELTQYALREPGFEHLRSSRDLELRVPVSVPARHLAAVTGGRTLNYLVLGDESAWTDILGTAEHMPEDPL